MGLSARARMRIAAVLRRRALSSFRPGRAHQPGQGMLKRAQSPRPSLQSKNDDLVLLSDANVTQAEGQKQDGGDHSNLSLPGTAGGWASAEVRFAPKNWRQGPPQLTPAKFWF